MLDIHAVPPELLSIAFEMGIHTSGLAFIYPVSLVCRTWYDIVSSTPRLWGILSIERTVSTEVLRKRIAKAKASPLSITVSSNVPMASKRIEVVLQDLTALSRNWVTLHAGLDFISLTRWQDLYRNLEELTLTPGKKDNDGSASNFFEGIDPKLAASDTKLHTFTAISLPRSWIQGFLGPKLRHLSITGSYRQRLGTFYEPRRRDNIQETVNLLSRAPNIMSIELGDLLHVDPVGDTPPVIRLQKLQRIKMVDVQFATSVLTSISATSLQTLSLIDNRNNVHDWYISSPSTMNMSPFFAQWSQPGFTPSALHTLELVDCLSIKDVPFLIRWLDKLPNLVRLFLEDNNDVLEQSALKSNDIPVGPTRADYEHTDLLRALAFPRIADDGTGTWLCPSLMVLRFAPEANIWGLIFIARSRGGIAPYVYDENKISRPARLRQIESHLCFNAEQQDIDMFMSLADQVYCRCLSCGIFGKAPR